MARIIYTAQRELVLGHSAGVEYVLEFDASVENLMLDPEVQTQQSLSGIQETLYYRIEKQWSVSSKQDVSEGGPYEQFLEFLASTFSGEEFRFDPRGTIASPSQTYEVKLVPGNTTPGRLGRTLKYSFSFRVRLTGNTLETTIGSTPAYVGGS